MKGLLSVEHGAQHSPVSTVCFFVFFITVVIYLNFDSENTMYSVARYRLLYLKGCMQAKTGEYSILYSLGSVEHRAQQSLHFLN